MQPEASPNGLSLRGLHCKRNWWLKCAPCLFAHLLSFRSSRESSIKILSKFYLRNLTAMSSHCSTALNQRMTTKTVNFTVWTSVHVVRCATYHGTSMPEHITKPFQLEPGLTVCFGCTMNHTCARFARPIQSFGAKHASGVLRQNRCQQPLKQLRNGLVCVYVFHVLPS